MHSTHKYSLCIQHTHCLFLSALFLCRNSVIAIIQFVGAMLSAVLLHQRRNRFIFWNSTPNPRVLLGRISLGGQMTFRLNFYLTILSFSSFVVQYVLSFYCTFWFVLHSINLFLYSVSNIMYIEYILLDTYCHIELFAV